MRNQTSAKPVWIAFFVFVIAASGSLVFAQTQTTQQTQGTLFTDIEVKPGMGEEFEKIFKNELIPAFRKGGTKEMSVWETAVFGKMGRYVITQPVANIGEFDGPSPLLKALGPKGMAALMAKLQPLIVSGRMFITSGMSELVIEPPNGYVPKLGFEVIMSIIPGRDADFIKNAKAAMDVVRKTNAKGAYALRVGLGGNPNECHILVLLESFADIAKFGPAFGKAAAEAKLAPMTGTVTSIEYTIYSYKPELSMPTPAP